MAIKTVIPIKILKELLPNICGKRLMRKSTNVVQQRIALGFSSERGDHPWQVGEISLFSVLINFKNVI